MIDDVRSAIELWAEMSKATMFEDPRRPLLKIVRLEPKHGLPRFCVEVVLRDVVLTYADGDPVTALLKVMAMAKVAQ